MSTDAPAADGDAGSEPTMADQIEELREELAEVKAAVGDDQKRMVIISTKGTLDMAYPPLILASTAAAFGWDVTIFHTFWGLDILHKEKTKGLKLSAVGNPSLPMPNLLAAIPGMDSMATRMMKSRIEKNKTATIQELIDVCLESGVELQACQMTQDLMGYGEDDFIDGVTVGVGAATAIDRMADADVQLLV